ncbi:MAG TPA: ATP synthase F1 subunit delta [Candidatus Goldiibacteriota bacterium]|nr:ATP synthase F1 subunit delta [Candidatus Goldiibacteriota bacterium]HPN65038.1 ATP synthase F1 subunit delta [Candidatus Goldiibacteriota bacterium]HRQ44889.1 ATP synthase F1 subunit delta [Candidatus Goldiibacteriota bacterium]
MINTTLPAKYAEALFQAAENLNQIEKVREDLELVKNAAASSREFAAILGHPGVSKASKRAVVAGEFKEKISRLALNFICLLIDKKREGILESVYSLYAQKADELLGIKRVQVKTAYELSAAEETKVLQQLESTFKKKVRMDARVDKGILGGIIVRDNMTLIDASVKQYLDSMKKELKEGGKKKQKKGTKKKK